MNNTTNGTNTNGNGGGHGHHSHAHNGYGDPTRTPPVRRIYSAGQIAKILGVSARSVASYIDSGQLKGFRLPPGPGISRQQGGKPQGDRRVTRHDLEKFIREWGMPRRLLDDCDKAVLLVGCDETFTAAVKNILGEDIRVISASTPFAAGSAFQYAHPEIVVVDCSIGCGAALEIGRHIATQTMRTTLVALLNEDTTADADGSEWKSAGYSLTLTKPCDPGRLVGVVMGQGSAVP